MERKGNLQFYGSVIAAVLVIHQLCVLPGVMCRTFEDQKTYYPPDPNHGSPNSPSHGGGGRPSHGTPSTPSHSTPSTPSHSTPSTPSHGGGGCPPTTTTPSPSRGSYSPPTTPTPVIVTPPTPVIVTPPTPIITPPITGGGPPAIVTPSTPTDPDFSSPPTPLIPDDPNLPPFIGTCDFWRTHPTLVYGLFGWWASLGSIFGGVGGVAVVPSSLDPTLTLPQALSNTHTDGIGALYREGVASLLNSMVTRKFPLTPGQIKESFVKSLSSEKAARNQAQLFKKANEGRYKHRA